MHMKRIKTLRGQNTEVSTLKYLVHAADHFNSKGKVTP